MQYANMSRVFLFLLLLPPLQVFSQNRAAEKLADLNKSGNIESIYLKTTYYKSSWYKHMVYIKDAMSRSVYTYKDTIYEKNGDYETGRVTLDTLFQFLHTRIGPWRSYYSTGSKKSEGVFLSGATIWCSPGGPKLNIYSYKSGKWIFWYSNGQMMAMGIFLNQKEHFENECEGGDYKTISTTTPKWKFYDEAGNLLKKPTSKMKEIIDETGTSWINL